MKIILSKQAGFCYGVKRAVDKTWEVLNKNQRPVYMLGEIVHNKDVVKKLAQAGAEIIDNLSEAKNHQATLLIRAHGATPETMAQAKKLELNIVDATCPMVKLVHNLALKMMREGYQVVLAGDKGHEEVNGILGTTANKAIVVENPDEAAELKYYPKIALLSQTTQSLKNLQAIAGNLAGKCAELRVFNTICSATSQRQNELIRLAKLVDLMIVIGSRHSANTVRLAKISKSLGIKTHHIDSSLELKKAWFKGIKKVGVTAGASTPDWIIQEVIAGLKKF